MPKITAFIPVYNRADISGEAINSILNQTEQDFELILIDDGSTDQSPDVLQSFAEKDNRIIFYRNEKNLGQPRTRNKALDLASGQYFASLDSDDLAKPQRFRKQMLFLDKNPEFAEIGSWTRIINATGRKAFWPKLYPPSHEMAKAMLLFKCPMTHASIMGRTEILREFRYDTDYIQCQDYDLHRRISQNHKIGNIPACLTLRRAHPGQITKYADPVKKGYKIRILENLFKDMELEYKQDDIENHYYLSRPAENPQRLEKDYKDWAKNWGRHLQTHNDQLRFFSPVALKFWLAYCMTANGFEKFKPTKQSH